MSNDLEAWAARLGVAEGVLAGLGAVFALLLGGSLLRISLVRWVEPDKWKERLASLLVWWGGLILVSLVAIGGPTVAAIVFGAISFVGLNEYLRILDRLVPGLTGRIAAYATVPAIYFAAWWNDDLIFSLSGPAAGLFVVALCLVLSGRTKGYAANAGGLFWGTIVIVYFPAHAVRLLAVSPSSNPVGGAAGWFVFLIVLTECNDIFQALWGRRLGKTKITPRISPNKSLEGLIGGILTTLALAIVLSHWLTPLAETWSGNLLGRTFRCPYAGAIIAWLVIAVPGFVGDLNMSALKRDAGVKDTGHWLPSQGGILDRVDSLTFTAPMFYYFVRLLGD